MFWPDSRSLLLSSTVFVVVLSLVTKPVTAPTPVRPISQFMASDQSIEVKSQPIPARYAIAAVAAVDRAVVVLEGMGFDVFSFFNVRIPLSDIGRSNALGLGRTFKNHRLVKIQCLSFVIHVRDIKLK